MSGENQAGHSVARRVRLAHLGLLVRDVARMQTFYTTVLGLRVSDRGVSERRGQEMTFMTGDPAVHHHLVLVGAGDAAMEERRLDHLAFEVSTLADLRAVRDRASAAGADTRAADHGNAWSVYFADPEGNRVEVLAVSPHVAPQPRGRPLDLDQPDACIEAETRRNLAGALTGLIAAERPPEPEPERWNCHDDPGIGSSRAARVPGRERLGAVRGCRCHKHPSR